MRRVLERYFEALRSQDWEGLGACLAQQVERDGPYRDVVRGRRAYVEFLSRVVPGLKDYELTIRRVRELGDASAVVELSESLELDGVRAEFPEALFFDFDEAGLIRRIDIYLKQPPAAASDSSGSD